MDFSLSEEKKMFKDMARKLFEAECDKSVIRKLAESETGHGPELLKKWRSYFGPEHRGRC